MSLLDRLRKIWSKMRPGLQRFGNVLKGIWTWFYRLRSVVLAIPVATAAVFLALYNQINLPAKVGIDLQATGEFATLINRELAVFGPLAITAVCLLLMFCSRKVVYPWLISLFSLVLPLLLMLTSIFPG